jgi:hypothetical protein
VTMTSATTALAFAGNLASSVAPVRLFGAYMAALVACNYWLVCTSVPSLLVLAEKRKKKGQLSFSREQEQRQRVRQAETGSSVVERFASSAERRRAGVGVDYAVVDASGVADAVGATAVPPVRRLRHAFSSRERLLPPRVRAIFPVSLSRRAEPRPRRDASQNAFCDTGGRGRRRRSRRVRV